MILKPKSGVVFSAGASVRGNLNIQGTGFAVGTDSIVTVTYKERKEGGEREKKTKKRGGGKWI